MIIEKWQVNAHDFVIFAKLCALTFEAGENTWYETVNGKPCFLVEYLLDEESYASQPVHSETEERHNSYYKIYVNMETGVIEQYECNSGLGGIG